MKQIISALFLCMLLSGIPGLQRKTFSYIMISDVLCMIKFARSPAVHLHCGEVSS